MLFRIIWIRCVNIYFALPCQAKYGSLCIESFHIVLNFFHISKHIIEHCLIIGCETLHVKHFLIYTRMLPKY